MNWDLTVNFIIAIIAILNPLGIIPVWSELTSDKSQSIRVRIALYATLTAALILILFLVTGEAVLLFFKIDLPAFRVAGGVLLFITGLKMIEGQATRLEQREEDGESLNLVAKQRFRKIIVPLTVPMLAGPGSITTVIIYGTQAGGVQDYAALSVVVLLALLVLFSFFSSARFLERKLDPTVFTVFTRVFGLIIAAIAAQFILEAVAEVYPLLLQGGTELNMEDAG